MEQLAKYLAQLVALVRGWGEENRLRFNLVAGTTAITAAIAVGFYLLQSGASVVLATNLSPADRTALALRLRRHGISFQLGADSITIPSRDARQAERLLDGSPGFSGGDSGFSLFDRSTLGQSDFDEQVNYQRSLQGELERTIMDIHGIDSARVMLAMGHPSPFALGPAEATHASVLLTTSRGAVIDSLTARAVAHLVASSVRGLAPDQITITGNDGAILFPPPAGDAVSDALRIRNDLERRLQQKVTTLLGSIMGQGRFAAEVSADLDTSQVSTKEEIYGNGERAVVSEEHSVSPISAPAAGIPGLTSNLPAPSPAATPAAVPSVLPPPVRAQSESADLVRKDIVNYKPSSREVSQVTAPVRVRRISVAAVLDGTYEGGEFKPLPRERLEAIKGLVAAAIGAQPDRGDSVDVQSAALSRPYVPPVVNPVADLRQLLGNPRYLYGSILAGFLLLAVLMWLLVRALRGARGAKAAVRKKVSAPVVSEPAQPAVTTPAETPASPTAGAYDEVKQRVNEQADRDPEAAAEILRKWITPESKTGNNGDQTATS